MFFFLFVLFLAVRKTPLDLFLHAYQNGADNGDGDFRGLGKGGWKGESTSKKDETEALRASMFRRENRRGPHTDSTPPCQTSTTNLAIRRRHGCCLFGRLMRALAFRSIPETTDVVMRSIPR